jgi:hypothetical protein
MKIEREDIAWVIALSFLGIAVVCRAAIVVLTILN